MQYDDLQNTEHIISLRLLMKKKERKQMTHLKQRISGKFILFVFKFLNKIIQEFYIHFRIGTTTDVGNKTITTTPAPVENEEEDNFNLPKITP